MPTVKELRLELERLVGDRATGPVRTFLTELAKLDSRDLSELVKKMTLLDDSTQETSSPPDVVGSSQAIQAVFTDDAAFTAYLTRLETDRRATRDWLNALYNLLFNKKRRLPARATRATLIRDIANERNHIVMSQKAAHYFSNKAS